MHYKIVRNGQRDNNQSQNYSLPKKKRERERLSSTRRILNHIDRKKTLEYFARSKILYKMVDIIINNLTLISKIKIFLFLLFSISFLTSKV